jgi:hypothetical protein
MKMVVIADLNQNAELASLKDEFINSKMPVLFSDVRKLL